MRTISVALTATASVRRIPSDAYSEQSSPRPFSTDASFKCYTNVAHPSGIFTSLHATNGALLNYGILLFVPDRMPPLALDCIRTVPAVNWRLLARHGGLEVSDIREYLAGSPTAFAEKFVRSLRTAYLQANLDAFFLRGAPAYLRVHFKHDTLLCGYRGRDRVVIAPIWKKDGTFGTVTLPLTQVVMSFLSSDGWLPHHAFTEYDLSFKSDSSLKMPVLSINVTGKCASLDPHLIMKQVEDALLSRCTYRSYIGDPLTTWLEHPGSYGLAAYDAFIKLCDEKAAAGACIDLTATRLMWEHKIIMLERIERLRSEGHAISTRVDCIYRELEQIAKEMHLLTFAGGGLVDNSSMNRLTSRLRTGEARALELLLAGLQRSWA